MRGQRAAVGDISSMFGLTRSIHNDNGRVFMIKKRTLIH